MSHSPILPIKVLDERASLRLDAQGEPTVTEVDPSCCTDDLDDEDYTGGGRWAESEPPDEPEPEYSDDYTGDLAHG